MELWNLYQIAVGYNKEKQKVRFLTIYINEAQDHAVEIQQNSVGEIVELKIDYIDEKGNQHSVH